MIRRRQDLGEELLGHGIPLPREIEVERGATGVYGSIQVLPVSGDANVGLIHPPGGPGPFQFRPDSTVQFRTIVLHPAPDRGVIDAQTSFHHHLLQVSIAQRKTKVPPNREDNNLVGEVPSPEECRSIVPHPRTLPGSGMAVCNTSLLSPLSSSCNEWCISAMKCMTNFSSSAPWLPGQVWVFQM
jgi:hypothetical protein